MYFRTVGCMRSFTSDGFRSVTQDFVWPEPSGLCSPLVGLGGLPRAGMEAPSSSGASSLLPVVSMVQRMSAHELEVEDGRSAGVGQHLSTFQPAGGWEGRRWSAGGGRERWRPSGSCGDPLAAPRGHSLVTGCTCCRGGGCAARWEVGGVESHPWGQPRERASRSHLHI